MVATALAAPDLLLAQSAKRIYRIATLEDAVESARPGFWRLFHDRLRELGRAAGWDFVIEARYARGATEQLPILAAQLVALKPDIIVTASTPATSAVMKESSSIPIVFVALGDPVATGLVKSFARPGGNATGTSILSGEIGGKWLELLREMQPAAIRIAYLGDASSRASVNTFRRISESAGAMGVSVQMHDAREQKALAQALEKIKRDGTQGLLVGTAGTLRSHRDQIIQFAAQERLPTIYGHPDYVHAGGLISYTVDYARVWARGADYVIQILKGAKPAEMPIEQPTNLMMVLNLKTARALGITIPASVRLRADEVIE